MLGLFKKTGSLTVAEIRGNLKVAYDIRDPYEVRFLNKNGNQRHDDGRSIKMPTFGPNPTLGIGSVAELCKKIELRFKGELENLKVVIWDAHAHKVVDGRTRYSTIRNP